VYVARHFCLYPYPLSSPSFDVIFSNTSRSFFPFSFLLRMSLFLLHFAHFCTLPSRVRLPTSLPSAHPLCVGFSLGCPLPSCSQTQDCFPRPFRQLFKRKARRDLFHHFQALTHGLLGNRILSSSLDLDHHMCEAAPSFFRSLLYVHRKPLASFFSPSLPPKTCE